MSGINLVKTLEPCRRYPLIKTTAQGHHQPGYQRKGAVSADGLIRIETKSANGSVMLLVSDNVAAHEP